MAQRSRSGTAYICVCGRRDVYYPRTESDLYSPDGPIICSHGNPAQDDTSRITATARVGHSSVRTNISSAANEGNETTESDDSSSWQPGSETSAESAKRSELQSVPSGNPSQDSSATSSTSPGSTQLRRARIATDTRDAQSQQPTASSSQSTSPASTDYDDNFSVEELSGLLRARSTARIADIQERILCLLQRDRPERGEGLPLLYPPYNNTTGKYEDDLVDFRYRDYRYSA